MVRKAVLILLAVPALLLPSAAYAGTTVLFAEVTKHGSKGTTVTLEEGVEPAGSLEIKSCANTSPTAFVCKGTGTVTVEGVTYGPARVRVRWSCPVHKSCAKKAEGTVRKRGNLLLLLHVRASVDAFQTRGSSFGVDVETIGE
jgi:hypothetical protein